MDGNQALAYGLIAAGVRYGAAYPITPWSTIMEMLRAELPKYGGIFVQAEDELAAVSYALGAAYAGHLAVTGSSGPGLSLKMEALSWAVMAEMPLIVVNVQRGGPSTGLPTSVEQSDLLQGIFGSHGDTPRVVLAPKNVEDCFYIALEAGRIARQYSTPVLILTDQSLATRIEAFDEPDLAGLMVTAKPDLAERGADFKPYPLDRLTRHAPPGTRTASGKFPNVTGLEHDEDGHPSGNPAMHAKMTARRREKIKALGADYVVADLSGQATIPELIKKAYAVLNLISFFTTGEDETRAWTIARGTKAPQASGVIHTDFETKFIRMEAISYEKLMEAKTWTVAKQKGWIRVEGKDYEVADGDVIVVRHG